MSKTISFEGKSSGDHECFCWAVTKNEYIHIMGKNPEEYDKDFFDKGLYKIYPNDIFPFNKRYDVTITITEKLDASDD